MSLQEGMSFEEAYAAMFNGKQKANRRLPKATSNTTCLEGESLDMRKVIKDQPGLTGTEIMEQMGLSRSSFTLRLRFLKRQICLEDLKLPCGKVIYFATQKARKKWQAENKSDKVEQSAPTKATYQECAQAGMTKAECAREIGVSRASVTKWSKRNQEYVFKSARSGSKV